MTLSETREKILTDDAFVLSEVAKLQYLTGLKNTIRCNLERAEDDLSESVAEHVYALFVMAEYFLRLEESAENLDKTKVYEHILFHDIDELELGDVPTNLKTEQDREDARKALPRTIEKSPGILQETITALDREYSKQELPETRFVKALDKIESVIHFYQNNQKPLFDSLKFTESDLLRTKLEYVQNYPIIHRFFLVILEQYRIEDFFHTPSC